MLQFRAGSVAGAGTLLQVTSLEDGVFGV